MSLLDKLLIKLPFGKKADASEYFFALNIGTHEISATTWEMLGHKIDILGQSATPYEGTEDILGKVGEVLDKSLGILEVEPQKIIFGVPDFWSQDDDLKEPYLKILRKILKEYDLTPLAYVTTTNALAHCLQQAEGVPPTALLLGIGESVEITLIRGGKVMENRVTPRGSHLFEDIEKTLLQFTEVEVLPSKILLYPTKKEEKLDKVKDELITFPWMQKLPFLHFPKIELLGENIADQAVILAAAVELDPEVNLKHSFSTSPQTILVTHHLAPDEEEKKKTADKKEEDEEDEKEEEKESTGPALRPYKKKGTLENLPETLEEDRLMDPYPPLQPEVANFGEYEGAVIEEARGILGKLKKIIKIPGNFLRNKKIPIKSSYLGQLLMVVVALVIVIGAYAYLVKAEVTIFVEPKVLTNETEVIADPQVTTADFDKKIIPGSVEEVTVSGSGKVPATGQKQIGDPARGKVVIYNKTTSVKSFSQGTVLTGPNNLKFTLDISVKEIASQSASSGADYQTISMPGKTDLIGITASAIGPESNLTAQTELTVGGLGKDQVVAQVKDALAGGTSKTITVITSDDQQKLQAQVVDDLRQEAQSKLQAKLPAEKKIVTEALAVIDGKYDFNKKINDQASEVSLNATVMYRGTAYSDTDLKTIISKLVETNVPDGYELDLKNSETQAEVSKVDKDGKLTFAARFKAKLLPKLNIDDLKKKIRGQSVDTLTVELKKIDNVLGSEIKFTPKLPTKLSRLPLLTRNISVIITPK